MGIGPDLKEKFKNLNYSDPEVSIVFPFLNEERFVKNWLLSSLAELDFAKLPRTEIVAVDNGSTDSTSLILKAHGIKVVEEARKGLGFARAKGVNEAQGSLIFQTDADTRVSPSWFQAHYNEYQKNTDLVAVFGNFSREGAHFSYKVYESLVGFRKFFLNSLLKLNKEHPGWVAHGFNMSYRKSCVTHSFELANYADDDGRFFEKIISQYGRASIQVLNNKDINVINSGRRMDTFLKVARYSTGSFSRLIRRNLKTVFPSYFPTKRPPYEDWR